MLTADAIQVAFTGLASELAGAATLTFDPDGSSETLTLNPSNPRSAAVSFDYDVGPEGAGEVRFDIAGADEPVYELSYVLELADAAIAGRVVVIEDRWRREVIITDKSGQEGRHQVTGLLGAMLFRRDWRRRAKTTTFEPYR